MIISIIAAVSNNNVIGKDNDLIWHLPNDMAFFKSKTKGHCILTGRRNYESIPEKFRPLPGRTNIIVSRKDYVNEPDVFYVKSIEEGIALAKSLNEEELFVIGGGQIYEQSMKLADRLFITKVHETFDGDTFFPEINSSIWSEESCEFHAKDDRHDYDMSFLLFTQK